MANLVSARSGEVIKIPNGGDIKDACEDFGVPFGCKDGLCGTCMIDVVEGENNFSPVNEKEKDMARDLKHRLACQCILKKGTVKIDY